MAKEEKSPDARAIFNKLGNLVASCIMLDAVRHNILGILLQSSNSESCFLTQDRNCKPHIPSVLGIFR